MWRRISLILICGLALLCVGQGPAGADDAALIDPSTTIVKVDGVPLSAGLILVPAGKDLEKWWAGEGHDSATQERVRKHLATYSEATVDTELLRAALTNARDRGGAAKAEDFAVAVEKYMPTIRLGLRRMQRIDDWSQKSPNAKPFISDWLASHSDAVLYSESIAQLLMERPDQTATVRAHWAAHRGEYLILRSAGWRQITVKSEQVKDVERLLGAQIEFEEVAKAKSQDRYQQEGGLVESKAPHSLIEDHVISALKNALPGKGFRVNYEDQVIFVMPETVDTIQAEFEEAAKQVRLDLARLKSGELAKVIAAKRRVQSRIEWEILVNN